MKRKRPERRRTRRRERPAGYYRVDGFDLREELLRLCRLAVFGGPGGCLARRPPCLTVRRASARPRSSLGFAIPSERRVSVTAYPGIRRGDLKETLLHELVHIAIGQTGRGSHGPAFRRMLKQAMHEGYGVTGVATRGSIHGAYADELERRRTARGRGRRQAHPLQLALDC